MVQNCRVKPIVRSLKTERKNINNYYKVMKMNKREQQLWVARE